MTDTVGYASFLLRLWRDSPSSQKAWQGEIEHIQTRQRFSFSDLDDLIAVLCRQLEQKTSKDQGKETRE